MRVLWHWTTFNWQVISFSFHLIPKERKYTFLDSSWVLLLYNQSLWLFGLLLNLFIMLKIKQCKDVIRILLVTLEIIMSTWWSNNCFFEFKTEIETISLKTKNERESILVFLVQKVLNLNLFFSHKKCFSFDGLSAIRQNHFGFQPRHVQSRASREKSL